MQIPFRRILILLLALTITGTVWWVERNSSPGGPPAEKQRAEEEKPRVSASENDLELLARAVFAESRGEPYEGQVAVAAVILNRVEHPEFPNTIPGVIYEPRAFSVVADGQINLQPDDRARSAAFDALHGLDPSGGALYFYNAARTSSTWLRTRPVTKTIGKHIFAS